MKCFRDFGFSHISHPMEVKKKKKKKYWVIKLINGGGQIFPPIEL